MSEPTSTGCATYILVFLAAIFGSFMAAFNSSSSAVITPSNEIITYVSLAPIVDTFTEVELRYAAEIISKRLTGLGLVSASVEIVDQKTIEVGLPQVENLDEVTATLSTRGLLEFVDFSDVPNFGEWEGAEILTIGQGDHPVFETAARNPTTNKPFITVFLGQDIETAKAELNDQYGQWQIALKFTEGAGGVMSAYTRTHIGKPLAIVLDGKVLSIPIIQSEISTEAVIAGDFTEETTRRLAVQLIGGALPFEMQVKSIR